MIDAHRTRTHTANGQTPTDHPELCVHDAFDCQATLTPEATAVIDGEQQVSYRELQRRAQRLALMLREAGVGPEIPVALLAERSVDAIIGLLGVLKAGGAYIPINVSDPDEHTSAIIETSGATLTLVQPHLRDRLRVHSEVIELNSVTVTDQAVRISPAAKAASVGTKDLAAIVYTSGSTGAPKGVEISHRSIMTRVRNGYRPLVGDLQKAPLSVVAHFSDLLLPLISGGPVIFLPDSCLKSGRGLGAFVRQFGTTRMVFVPSQLGALLDTGEGTLSALKQLHSVILSGEPLSASLVREFKRRLPHVALLNAYGASEVAGLACMGEVVSADDITVGHPIRGCTVYLLDENLNPTADGDEGEVYLGGAQLARGYHRNPRLTEERFVKNPIRNHGGLVYRTGDRAQRRWDGRIRIVGRCDLEVKVHGFRVNLAEIEVMLERLPNVQRAVVVSSASDAQRLFAFVLPQSSSGPFDSGTMRTALAQRLPSHMVPSRIQLVTRFPLLSNGKVDRVALAKSHSADSNSEDSASGGYIAPRTATERLLADLWQDVLGLSRVGATDDFFALGGDSLDSTRFILRAEAVGLRVTPDLLEDSPSLAELARAVDERVRFS